MFASKKLSLNEWKNWAIGLVGNTMSSIDQATSRWFLNLINGLPRDYFAKTFDQVNYLDKRVWEGMFRANIEEIKEQLELGVSESMFEADLVKLQGLVGKYTLSPVVYEDGLKELESFVSNLDNFCNYSKVLAEVKGEFREELRAQPSLLKGCIESDTDLGRGGNAYYNSLLDERGKKKALVTELPILDEVVVSKGRETNFRLRNISKLFLCNPGQAITLFLAVQVAVANAYSSNSTTVENSVLPFSNESFELKVSTSDSVSMQNTSSEDGRFVEILDVKVKESKEEGRPVEGLNHSSNSSNQGVERYKLFSNSTSPRVRVKRGKFVKGNDDVSLSSQITSLKATIDRQDSELKELRAKLSDNDENSRVRISALEKQKTSLKKSLDDMEKKSEQELSEKNSEIQNLMISVNQFSTEVSNLKKKIEEMELKHLPDECVKDIEGRRFNSAEEKLKRIGDETKIVSIIDKVYDSRTNQFPLLIEFCKNISDIGLRFSSFKALHDVLEHDLHKNAVEIIELASVVRSEVLSQENASLSIVRRSGELFIELKRLAANVARQELVDAMSASGNVSNDRVGLVSNEVYSLDRSLFRRYMKEAVNQVFGGKDTKEILNFLRNNLSSIAVRMEAYVSLFNVMQIRSNPITDDALVRLAVYIREMVNMDDYPHVDSEARGKLEELRNKLPESISVLAFAPNVCIRSAIGNQYLHVAGYTYRFGDKNREVSTWDPGGKVKKDEWQLQLLESGSFTIKSVVHNVYLYGAPSEHGRRLAYWGDLKGCYLGYTWSGPNTVKGCDAYAYNVFTLGATDNKSANWKILPVFRGVNIVNAFYSDRYLYRSSAHYPYHAVGEHLALAVPLDQLTEPSAATWEFQDCGGLRRRRDVKGAENASDSTMESIQENVKPSSHLSEIALEKAEKIGKNHSLV